MTSAWCPRCQKQVRVSTREVAGGKPGEKRVESLCAECGILLLARTLKPPSRAPW
jgi:hypothetical protein